MTVSAFVNVIFLLGFKEHRSSIPNQVAKSPSMVRMEMKKKGAAPKFVHGLEDMEVKEGASAAVAGQLAKSERFIT